MQKRLAKRFGDIYQEVLIIKRFLLIGEEILIIKKFLLIDKEIFIVIRLSWFLLPCNLIP